MPATPARPRSRGARASACALFAAVALAPVVPAAAQLLGLETLGDVSELLQNAGNRLATEGRAVPAGAADAGLTGRALNAWDLQAFDGKVYLGGGDTTSNPGPLNLWAFDLALGAFPDAPEAVVEAEAIENFRVFGGTLYVPNSDPTAGDGVRYLRRGPGDAGFASVRADGIRLAHTRDLVVLGDGAIVAVGNHREVTATGGSLNSPEAIAASRDGPSAAVSADGGATWSPAVDPTQIGPLGNWYYSAFAYGGRVFATTLAMRTNGTFQRFEPLVEFDPEAASFVRSGVALVPPEGEEPELRPGAVPADRFYAPPAAEADRLQDPATGERALGVVPLVRASVELDGVLVYAMATHSPFPPTRKRFYRNTLGLFTKKSLDADPVPVVFPARGAVGEDVLLQDNAVLALANRRRPDGSYDVYVYRSAEPTSGVWSEVLRFRSENLARSFEFAGGAFFFGLGFDGLLDEPDPASDRSPGTLLYVVVDRTGEGRNAR